MSGRMPYDGARVLFTNPGEPASVRFSLCGFNLTGINWVYLAAEPLWKSKKGCNETDRTDNTKTLNKTNRAPRRFPLPC